jgi:coenzyme Q-binding protein COQ10
MAGVTTNLTVNVPIEKFYEVIADVKSYPEFIPEMKNINILSMTDTNGEVEYELKIMGFSVSYTLKLQKTAPTELSWTFVKGTKMKNNEGHWKLKSIDENTTEAEYKVELALGALVPKKFTDQLTKVGLPNLMKQFKERAETL